LKEAGRLTKAWFAGWFPFSGLPALAGVVGSLIAGGRRQTLKKILIGVTVTIPLLGVLVTLLAGADRVFGYWAETLLSGWNLPSLIRHLFITLAAGSLFYAFLWKMKFNKRDDPAPQGSGRIDVVICCIVLGAVSLLYLLYCGIQFTYLFARAGLPNGLTYSGYAREGFAQTVVVTAVNLILFGLFLRYGKSSKPVKALLAGLLGLTGVILVSGCVRLGLYIEAYGLTWLRFLSAWFIVYLAAVLVICAVRMFSEKLPAIALAALLLLCWTVALGYANPDRFVERYNEGHGALRDQLSPLDHNVKREYGVF
ncbi:MAG: DUF4173 domain-containing protein, partial [Oscillospiraceae bacterium]|nr:DUF4173 domain-containing protein [Oscillospiraceae bacterium]